MKHIRTFNIGAVTRDGRTISATSWSKDWNEPIATLRKWVGDRKWYGEIANAVIYDTDAKQSRTFRTIGLGSRLEESTPPPPLTLDDDKPFASECEDCGFVTQRDENGRCENCGFKAEPKNPRTPTRKRGDGGRKFRAVKARLRDARKRKPKHDAQCPAILADRDERNCNCGARRTGFGVEAMNPTQAAEAARSHRARVFNPQNIEEGDVVRLAEPREGDSLEPMVVVNVGGHNCNKVFCKEIGHELYANCFELVLKKAEYNG